MDIKDQICPQCLFPMVAEETLKLTSYFVLDAGETAKEPKDASYFSKSKMFHCPECRTRSGKTVEFIDASNLPEDCKEIHEEYLGRSDAACCERGSPKHVRCEVMSHWFGEVDVDEYEEFGPSEDDNIVELSEIFDNGMELHDDDDLLDEIDDDNSELMVLPVWTPEGFVNLRISTDGGIISVEKSDDPMGNDFNKSIFKDPLHFPKAPPLNEEILSPGSIASGTDVKINVSEFNVHSVPAWMQIPSGYMPAGKPVVASKDEFNYLITPISAHPPTAKGSFFLKAMFYGSLNGEDYPAVKLTNLDITPSNAPPFPIVPQGKKEWAKTIEEFARNVFLDKEAESKTDCQYIWDDRVDIVDDSSAEGVSDCTKMMESVIESLKYAKMYGKNVSACLFCGDRANDSFSGEQVVILKISPGKTSAKNSFKDFIREPK